MRFLFSELFSKIRTATLFLAIAVCGSCDSEVNESPIVVFLTPDESQIDGNSEDHVFITINSSSRFGSQIILQVESVDALYGVTPVFDSVFNATKINYILDYIVPVYPDSTESLLVFKLRNDTGNEIQAAKRLLINRGSTSVKETSGHVLYSTCSSSPSAFSVEEVTPVFLADSLTQSLDIYDASEENDEAECQFSRTWMSRTDMLFVKFSGFNYADANAVTISNAYKSGVRLSRASNLQDSDIVIVGRGDKAVAAIQLIAVSDLEGEANDKYVFSIKKLLE
ncbi:MAG TPA: hypothetical protein VD927_06740 [Chryseosolibacter sp.]|nr:hypothetical protein [Chryseosolibacter sp.]